MPSGLRTPVASISVRVWIGIHQTFGMPGKRSFSSISSMSASHVMPARHCSRGLSTTVDLDHAERRGIGRGLGAALLAEDAHDLGELLELAVHRLQHDAPPRSPTCPGGAVGM